MSVGVWDPSKNKPETLDAEQLTRLQGLIDALDLEESITALPDDLQGDSWMMHLSTDDWAIADNLDDRQIEHLIRFFTLVERDISGWEAGKTSPVIPLVKLLKQRACFTPEMRKWIKRHTDNRYLPNGSAL